MHLSISNLNLSITCYRVLIYIVGFPLDIDSLSTIALRCRALLSEIQIHPIKFFLKKKEKTNEDVR